VEAFSRFRILLPREGSGYAPFGRSFGRNDKEYALDAFELGELGAVDYLVKPVLLERLMQTINRVAGERTVSAAPEGDSAKRLTANCLGGLTAKSRHSDVKWISVKSAELFAYLLMHRDMRKPQSRTKAQRFRLVSTRSFIFIHSGLMVRIRSYYSEATSPLLLRHDFMEIVDGGSVISPTLAVEHQKTEGDSVISPTLAVEHRKSHI